MAIESATFVRDLLFYIKNDLIGNITDPLSGTRSSNSAFVMTSYPQREAIYPIITIKAINYTAKRAGMQTTTTDMLINLEIRVWARNTKERDELFTSVFNRLRNIQFTAITGSEVNNLHDWEMPSCVEVDDEGQSGIKSKILQINYKFFNL